MKANKAYKFRLYPNAEQCVYFTKCFGGVRFIYNQMLAERKALYDAYKNDRDALKAPKPKTYSDWKKEYDWLYEIDNLALANAQIQLNAAYKNFFRDKAIGFPKFRSKKSGRKSYTTNNQRGTIRVEECKLRLPKIGLVRIKLHRSIPDGYAIKSVTVSQEPSGKYYASILTEYDAEPIDVPVDTALGLDYSSPHFYVDSDGNEADMPHFYREVEKKLAREQRRLAKMVKGSSNYRKQKICVAKAYEKVRNCRKDWQHKRSTELANGYDLIAVEDINYKNMARGLHLAKATNDNAFGQFRKMLSYKLAERGKKLITIDKWFPSTKTCRFCGNANSDIVLGQSEWDCHFCGKHLLRDHNAAINIRNQGLAMLA